MQDSSCPEGQTQAAQALCALAAHPDPDRSFAEAVLPTVARLLQGCTDALGRSYAAWALGSLASSGKLPEAWIPAALHEVCQMLKVCTASSWRLCDQSEQCDVLPQLSKLAVPMQVDPEPKNRRQAALAINYLVKDADLRTPIADAALPELVAQLRVRHYIGPDQPCTSNGSRLLHIVHIIDLARIDLKLTWRDMPDPYVLQEEDTQAQVVTADTFVILAQQDDLRKQIAQAALPSLASLLQGCADPEGRYNAARAICNLTVDARLHHPVVDAALQQLCLVLEVSPRL